jgi:hypothetical protein
VAITKTFGTASFNIPLPLPRFGQIHTSGSMSYGEDDARLHKYRLMRSFTHLDREDLVNLYLRCVEALATRPTEGA